MSFKSLKSNRKSLRATIEKAVGEVGKRATREEDTRFWFPIQDEKGAAATVFRYLPPADGQTLPWAKRFQHGFKGPNGWFIENCPTSIGQDCPVCAANKELWNTEIDSNRKLASERKRKEQFFYNILVVKDTDQPEAVGEVKLFKSGPYLFKMIQSAQNPEFEDDVAIDAFDMWEGANFNFKMYKKERQLTYDKSAFAKPSKICGGDETEMEAVYNKLHDLSEFSAETNFKSYADLEKKFNLVMGTAVKASGSTAPKVTAETATIEAEPAAKAVTQPTAETTSDTEDDALAMFEELANG